MKFIDLFAGVGGFHLGLERTEKNFEGVWANDWDKFSGEVYQKKFPKTKFSGKDIRTVHANGIPDCDLLCAGFPCQAFSLAGKRMGFKETRGTLFFEIARIAKETRPRLLFLENVKGLLSNNKGRTFATILSTLDEIGYDVEWEVLNSKNFGVPQNRERVFIIGHLRGESRSQIFPLRENSEKNNEIFKGKEQIASTINATYARNQSDAQYVQEGDGLNNSKLPISMRVYSPDGISSTLNSLGGGLGAKTGLYDVAGVAWRTRTYRNEPGHFEIRKDKIANQLTTVQKDSMALQGSTIRRLTPLECERLQGFPDNWTNITFRNEKQKVMLMSDFQRYKMMGNAVTVNVVQEIGKKISECEAS